MNGCCTTIESHFGSDHARDDLSRYRTKGPDFTTATILEFLTAEAIADATLLDIGGGIGVIPIELLGRGVASATLVDASPFNLEQAGSESNRKGVRDRMALVHGDLVEVSDRLEDADLVTLDRVVCCYPYYKRLIERSASKACKWYALSYPRDRWFVRLAIRFENGLRRLRQNPFRSFVHDPLKIENLLTGAGFRRHRHEQNTFWQIQLYRRI